MFLGNPEVHRDLRQAAGIAVKNKLKSKTNNYHNNLLYTLMITIIITRILGDGRSRSRSNWS